MPKSKRARVVHLTKVDKKGKELTLKLFSNVRECLDEYQYCFVFSVENMRNTYLKDVRNQLSDCRSVSQDSLDEYALNKLGSSLVKQKLWRKPLEAP
jgi:ribosomal protein L10